MLDSQKRRLLNLREALLRQNKAFREQFASAASSRSVIDEVDEIQCEEALGTTAGLADVNDSSIVAIDLALRAIAEGTYGKCQVCHRDISLNRLAALPFATVCLGCQQEVEAVA